jgi:hypothetical protein
METKRFLVLFGSLFGGIGLLLLAICTVNISHTREFLAEAETATGTVIELVKRRSRDSDGYATDYYYPVVEFTAFNGDLYQFESQTGSSPPSVQVGEAVEIIYDPENIKDARIRGFFSLWGFAFIFGLVGTIYILVGSGIIVGAIVIH